MQILNDKMWREGKRVVFSATTNKAAAVLKSKTEQAITLHKAFGIKATVDLDKAYELSALVNVVGDY